MESEVYETWPLYSQDQCLREPACYLETHGTPEPPASVASRPPASLVEGMYTYRNITKKYYKIGEHMSVTQLPEANTDFEVSRAMWAPAVVL
ncbi:Alpha-(1,3)-Fucosyltransferase 7 [Manis pentadactyla]|nr:Alpha-(1,3)-Fucosyltransferase 7 [Manis pentadactyla]